jgi:uncharacterized protein YdeI (BOF family)
MQLHKAKLALVGLLFLMAGCGKAPETTLGVQPASATTVTVKELANASKDQKVTLRGEMIEKCPVAGCWFILRDKTGTVRVDTKAAGFVVSEVPLHTTMTVSGAATPGTQPGLSATGLSY